MPFDLEIELGGETHGAQHAHRVFLVALLGVADQPDQAIADVVYATGVVEDALGSRIVIQRIDGEVAALGVVFEGAIDVVTQDAAALVARSEMAGVVVILFRMVGAEGGDLDDLATEMNMHQLETASDHAGVAEFGADLFGGRAGRDVVILGIQLQQQVAHAAADHICLVTRLLQSFDHAHRVTTDLVAMQGMLPAGQNFRCAAGMRDAAQRKTKRLEQLFQHGGQLCGGRRAGVANGRETCADSSTESAGC